MSGAAAAERVSAHGRLASLPRVHWSGIMPPEMREVVEPLLARLFLARCPRWLYDVCVFWRSDDETPIAIESEYKYRKVALYVSGAFLSETRTHRAQLLVHEMVHAYQAPCVDVVGEMDLSDDVMAGWKRALEASCTDLTELLLAVLDIEAEAE